jgi:phosphate transport system substrate-binding protein
MKKFLFVLSVLFLNAGLVFVGCDRQQAAPQSTTQSSAQGAAAPYTISTGGSTSVAPLMELFKAEYEGLHNNITITISASGSGDGIRGAPAGTFEIGMSSRDLTPAEKGTDIQEYVVAIDGIAVIVNNASPISSLTRAQIREIYTGEVSRWEQLGAVAGGKSGPIAVISREPGSGTRGAFEEIVGFQDRLVHGAIEFDGTGAVKAEVSRNVDAIGYISLGSVDSTSRAISVDGVAATTANVVNGSYAIARPFILMTKRSAPLNANTSAFIDWMMGPGQSIVERSWIRVN